MALVEFVASESAKFAPNQNGLAPFATSQEVESAMREALRRARMGKNYRSPKDLAKVKKRVLKMGDQKSFPKKGDRVDVHYIGKLKRGGLTFDSSVARGTPFSFSLGLGQVIEGWDRGVLSMCLGEKAELEIPAILGYGERGVASCENGGRAYKIPPHADLIFEVELLAINSASSAKLVSLTDAGIEKVLKWVAGVGVSEESLKAIEEAKMIGEELVDAELDDLTDEGVSEEDAKKILDALKQLGGSKGKN